MTETQTTNNDWLKEEISNKPTNQEFEALEPLKLETNKITTFSVDFSKPFAKWNDMSNGITKAIIPVMHKEVRKNLWLNVRNPLYSEICSRGLAGQTTFKVSTVGTQKDTRYTIVEED